MIARNLKNTKYNFIKKFIKLKLFCTSLKGELENIGDNLLLNDYLKESLTYINENYEFKHNQINIVSSIKKNDHSIILCDEFSGRKYSCALGIINKIIEINSFNKISDSDELFVNTLEFYNNSKNKPNENLFKKLLKPRGALVICQRYEFVTNLYRIYRKLDFKNKLRMVRLGTSLHNISPTIDLDGKNTTDTDDLESQEILLGNVNLINTTQWKNIDILFTTINMLEYVLDQKDKFDYYDINPEIIMIEDFDYMLNNEKYDVKKFLLRYFASNSKFESEYLKMRKLILSSSSVHLDDLIFRNNFDEVLRKSLEIYTKYLNNINKDIFNKLDIVSTPFFMDLNFHVKDVKVFIKIFQGENKIIFEDKLKYLISILNNEPVKTVICCLESNISILKEILNKKKLKFKSIDENEKVGSRLFSLMQFNCNQFNTLLILPIFLKSLNIFNIQQLIVFDYPDDNKDLIRILSNLSKLNTNRQTVKFLCSKQDAEKNKNIIEYFDNLNK